MADLTNIGYNLAVGSSLPEHEVKVDFYIFMTKEGKPEKHFM